MKGSLAVFNSVSLDGYFTGPNGELDWAHRSAPDPEFDAFVADNAGGDGSLLLGRKTYDMMAKWWPTPAAAAAMPEVAEGMNRMAKLVASRTMPRADWSNTSVVRGELVDAVRRLKAESDASITSLGSGSVVAQLAAAGLIDEIQMVVVPVVLGRGRTMFDGVAPPLGMRLARSRVFPQGKVFLAYQPAG
jgi:dihydrofolate reductase